MTDTTDLTTGRQNAEAPDGATQESGTAPTRARRRGTGGGLSAKVLPELQALAAELGLTGTGRMRKSQLIEVITAAQGGEQASGSQGDGQADAAQSGSEAGVSQGGGEASATQGDVQADGSKNGAPKSGGQQAATQGGATTAAAPAEEPTGSGTSKGAARTRRRASSAAGAAAPAAATAGSAAPDAPPSEAPGSASGSRTGSVADQLNDDDDGDGDGDAGGRNERVDRGRERFLEREARRQERAAAAAGEDGPSGRGEGGDRNDNRSDRNDNRSDRNGNRTNRNDNRTEPSDRNDRNEEGRDRGAQRGTNRESDTGRDQNRDGRQGQDDGPQRDEEEGGRRGRFRERGRGRNRSRNNERYGGDPDPVVQEDDVLVPIGGILDVGESHAFVRTSGYLAGPNDVYVTLNQVRRYGLRPGDAVTGQVRQQREGDRKDRYNALVRLDSVNGLEVDEAHDRPEFAKLTPLHPQDRLRLETDPKSLTARVIDLVMPVGKGQRALIVSPPQAGKTTVLQAIANAVSVNNPEVHLMVVLVDERPEEVTDMKRSVKGEVIASAFDRPPSDHTSIAELSIERAKRLVELGHDVVLLLDSITRLGRAYNLSAPAGGRVLTGGVDAAATYPPKRFLGAARNIEDGGSLTIFATALSETGSATDSVIFEELRGTSNAELRLDRSLADEQVFPAVDVQASGTRKQELLLSPDELGIVQQLRTVLKDPAGGTSLGQLLDRVGATRTNIELLMQVQQSASSPER